MKKLKAPPLISIDLLGDFQAPVEKAAHVLSAGGVVAYPTETFYGLAVDVRNDGATKRLFDAKKRPANRPVLILIPFIEALDAYVAVIPPVAHRLIEAFWPGGLTLVFEAGPRVSPMLTAGTGKIGIRLSSHPVATALARAINGPISGTSANLSGEPPCRSAQEIRDSMGGEVDLILDAGKALGKIGSTVLDVTGQSLRVLREGVLTRKHLAERSFDVP